MLHCKYPEGERLDSSQNVSEKAGTVQCHLKAQIGREGDRLELLLGQIEVVEGGRNEDLASARATTPALAMLLGLKGIGEEFATVSWVECLYRHFDNRRRVAAYAGLTPTPWQGGSVNRDQGVS